MGESENTVTAEGNQVSSSELEQILLGARKMESDARRKGRDDLVEKARNMVDQLAPGESGSKDA